MSNAVGRRPVLVPEEVRYAPRALAEADWRTGTLTVIVPAYNEADHIADTVRSLQEQTRPPEVIMVVDDFSDDGTGEIAAALGATVMRPAANTGSKAGAQNFALEHVWTAFVMILDADTTLASDAIEKTLPAFEDPAVAAACGFVIPRHVNSVWERGRYVEYLFAFSFHKQVQDYYGRPLISSGCFSVYRCGPLRQAGGWGQRTMAEDMDLTWTLYELGHRVRFIPESVSYPVEPRDLDFMRKQLTRWSHAFVQNVRVHWRGIVRMPYLFSAIAVALSDAVLASLVFLVALPVLAVLVSPLFLIGYVVDAPVIAVPVLIAAARRGEVMKALASLPAFFVLRLVNGYLLLKALAFELVLRRPLTTYEKGH
ncbi:MAG: glycosyltransferase family 2 protein [Actinomycetota bacterium]|nr:glycosyltransferase family 2 protein [Actinomycetota bacterium]